MTSKRFRYAVDAAPKRRVQDAFTRLELVAVVACLGLLGATGVSVSARTQQAGGQAACVNNLRQIGRAFALWGKDRGNTLPWRTPAALGGSFASTKPSLAWVEFAWISNELVNPKLLACPSDPAVLPARDFSRDFNGGYLNPTYRNNATSYFIGTDAGYANGMVQGSETTSSHLISGDRNLRVDSVNQACSAGFNNVAGISFNQFSRAGWTNDVHGLSGNILLNNGAVLQLTTAGFRDSALRIDDNGVIHLLIP